MKKEKNALSQLFDYYKRYPFFVGMIAIFSIGYAIVGLLSPIYSGKLLSLFGVFDKNEIIKVAVIIFLLDVITEILDYLWGTVGLKLYAKVTFDLKSDVLISITNFETKNFDNTNSAVLMSRLNKDTSELAVLFDWIAGYLCTIIIDMGFLIYVFYINIYMGLFLILNMIVRFIISSNQLKSYTKVKKASKEKEENVIGLYNDTIKGIREIKDLNMKSIILGYDNKAQQEAIDADVISKQTLKNWSRINALFQYSLNFIFILLSIYLISKDNLALSSFMIIYVYKSRVSYMIKIISDLREKLADGKICAERVFDIINYESFSKETFGTTNVDILKGNVEFKNVKFSYNNIKLFEDLSFEVEPNKMTAIVGKSGEGKSTILKLIDKNYNIDGGQILIDGYDINDLTEDSLRNNISIVSQSPYIFNLSIKDNIRLADPNATDEEIIEVCKQAQIHSDIISMEDGYDTVVGENGVILSGGQKQRVAIARALIKKTNIILFDEATSALDNSNQEKIKNVIRDLSKDHTIIIVAHRLSTIVDSDDILVLDDHKICAHGTHNGLINNSIEYRKLYEMEE